MLWYEKIFIYVTYIVYFLFFVGVVGVSNYIGLSKEKSREYLDNLDYFRQIYVGITLILVFNPWTRVKHCTEFHKKIIFSSAIFLLLPLALSLFPQLKDIV